MKYKVGDIVRLKKPHSEGDLVRIQSIEETVKTNIFGKPRYKTYYKIYIPYWDNFYITDDDIIEKVENF